MTAQQFAGHTPAGEWLVTIFPAEGNKPASAEAAFRPDQWQSWGAPILLTEVPS